ncbi:MAG: KH domain-containing protein [Chloroflexi bacterium]|nr:KH domain-containing protein [Chloroflexota bacterium]
MNERTTLEIIAPTVEEALAQGLSQLGLTAEAVSVEVLDSGTNGLFGLGGRQVRVRISVNPPPESVMPVSHTIQKPDAEKKTPVPRRQSTSRPLPEKKAVEQMTAPERKPIEPAPRPVIEGHDPLLDRSEEVVSKLIHLMGMKAQVSAHYEESGSDERRNVLVDVRGEDLSALIGRHAETLNAFQYVASLIVGKGTQQWVQLIVDVEGYRSRREQQLRQLARRMAEQVIKTGRKTTMEPMASNERRVVHIELRGHPAVMTESVGEEPYRKVVILPKE